MVRRKRKNVRTWLGVRDTPTNRRRLVVRFLKKVRAFNFNFKTLGQLVITSRIHPFEDKLNVPGPFYYNQ